MRSTYQGLQRQMRYWKAPEAEISEVQRQLDEYNSDMPGNPGVENEVGAGLGSFLAKSAKGSYKTARGKHSVSKPKKFLKSWAVSFGKSLAERAKKHYGGKSSGAGGPTPRRATGNDYDVPKRRSTKKRPNNYYTSLKSSNRGGNKYESLSRGGEGTATNPGTAPQYIGG